MFSLSNPISRVLFFLLTLGSSWATAQTVGEVEASIEEDQVTIKYNLSGNEPFYKVQVFQSSDEFSRNAAAVTGDVGDQVKPGTGKVITWSYRNDLPSYFSGDIQIKVVAKRTGKIVVQSIPAKVKKGKSVQVKWQGGESNTVQISLLKDNKVVASLDKQATNNGTYRWVVPKKLKPGKNYALSISNYEGRGMSKLFTVKPVISKAMLYGGAAVVVGGVLIMVLKGSGGSGGGEEDGSGNALPSAPDLPSGG